MTLKRAGIGLLAIISFGTVLAFSSNGDTRQRPSSAQVASAPPAPIQFFPKPAKPLAYKPNCNQPRDREEYEACLNTRSAQASEDAARSARNANGLSARANTLGVLQAAGLVLSLIFTAWAAISAAGATKLAKIATDEARKSSEQSRRSADVAEKALLDTQRAFIAPDGINETRSLDPKTGQVKAWDFWFSWKNTGVTPAFACESHVTSFYFLPTRAEHQDIPIWWPFEDPPAEHVRYFLAPGQTRNAGPVSVPIDLLEKLYKSNARLYFHGWIKYVTFGVSRETRFCIELRNFDGDPADLSKEPSVLYLHWARYNCADEECEREDREAFAAMPHDIRMNMLLRGWRPRFTLTAEELMQFSAPP